ncbi:hypothetical protein SBV1_460055 [Verrucomicrobia bacterium]|nr:hypothetical protein SBV1_460055 [Verrucomicrobiota bacterium]
MRNAGADRCGRRRRKKAQRPPTRPHPPAQKFTPPPPEGHRKSLLTAALFYTLAPLGVRIVCQSEGTLTRANLADRRPTPKMNYSGLASRKPPPISPEVHQPTLSEQSCDCPINRAFALGLQPSR